MRGGKADVGRLVNEVVKAYRIFFWIVFLSEIENKVISSKCGRERSYWESDNRRESEEMD